MDERPSIHRVGVSSVLGLLAAAWLSVLLADRVGAEDSVPTTVDGGAAKVKQGGQEIGAGFTGIGRGIANMFTGERSKDEFKKAGSIGTGFKDLGLGTAGVGRGVGRGVRDGFTGDSEGGTEKESASPPVRATSSIQEETLENK